jgi:hypothetical protein
MREEGKLETDLTNHSALGILHDSFPILPQPMAIFCRQDCGRSLELYADLADAFFRSA